MLTSDNLAEEQLQQELREMFLLDTEQQLQSYFEIVQQLNPRSWVADIQSIYRAIHTIKGGAVTVEANSMLYAGIILEQLLSDLRYLEVPPPLSDGDLSQVLLEAGELLASCLEVTESGDRGIERSQLTLQRLETLHIRVKARYLPDWNEMKQVHQEFAEQGFDLVVLEFEMVVNQLPPIGIVPPACVQVGVSMLAQLREIGVDLEFAPGWAISIDNYAAIIDRADCQELRSSLPKFLVTLKRSAKDGGEERGRGGEGGTGGLGVWGTRGGLEGDDKISLATISSVALFASVEDSIDLEMGVEISALTIDSVDDNSWDFGDDFESESMLGFNDNLLDDLLPGDEWDFEAESASISSAERLPARITNEQLLDDLLPGDEWDFETESPPVSSAESLQERIANEQLLDDLLPGDEWNFEAESASISSAESLRERIANEQLLDDLLPGDEWDFEAESASISSAESLRERIANEQLLDDLLPGDEWDFETESASISSAESLRDRIANEQLLDDLLLDEDVDIFDAGLNSGSLELALEEVLVSVGSELNIKDNAQSKEIGDFLDDFLCDFDLETYNSSLDPTEDLSEIVILDPVVAELSLPPVAKIQTEETIQNNTETRRNIQIPVPLARLDRSAQQVVDTLLTTRGINSQSQILQTQLAQLTGLTMESAQFATKLRQLQDDYSLLRNLSDEQDAGNNVTLERYRQGYTTINRLLENILRMSELGQEIEVATHQTFDKLADLDRQMLLLKDGIEVSRLVPFRNLTMRARAILRDLTNRYGKPVDLVVNNEQIELDAGVVQQLEPALLHLLRNAYDHGVEPTEERLAIGKPATAKVVIALQRRGNIYRLTLKDDGRGIDRSKISNQAQARGFAHTNTSTNADLLTVLCQPGFSSRDVVSEVSGRGVGMDVVAHQIAAIGGKLHLDTEMGKGSTFSIEVPAPQLLVSCVLLRVGDRTVAIPTADILETVLLSTVESKLAMVRGASPEENRSHWQITTPAGVAPGFSLASYWQQFSSSLPEYAIGLRCRLEDNSAVWLIADDLLDRSDLSINPLPSPLIPPAGFLGVSLQPDGRLISVLDPIALTNVLQSQSKNDTPTPKSAILQGSGLSANETTTTTILVVDDAALMRRRLSASLTTAGYVIHTCGDGLEALKWLQTNELPAMMITDVEMPNMDGLTLIDRCRQTGIEIPILVISSRLSEGWSNEAKRVGANNYLNKGFTTDMLLTTVRDLLSPQLTPAI